MKEYSKDGIKEYRYIEGLEYQYKQLTTTVIIKSHGKEYIKLFKL